MPPCFKDSWCLLVSDPAFGCWQLCQTILRLGGNFYLFFFQGGLWPPVKLWGKISAREAGCFQE